MRIEELILDGFKSYPVRTTISGFDESFNAITGLNGSGKSNILDAICFVLGITNMTSVRAGNLMDLIYKRGQAGVTKASVTIVFNNQDRSKSPVGFENTPQITVTRQIAVGNVSKYLLNGHKSTLQTIQNLFQSVQLNINNPNFLIMQGKITKVLNMKPAEILGMVEEAAGTRMFEERKDKAVKTMSKKDKKVEEISTLLREEIEPKLEKLRAEKRSYLEYQKATSELERLTRLVKAYEWRLVVDKLEKSGASLEQKHNDIAAAKEDITRGGEECKVMEKELQEIEASRAKEMAKGGKMQALADAVNELERELVKINTQLEIKESTVADDAKRVEGANSSVAETKDTLAAKKETSEKDAMAYAELKEAYDAGVKDLERTERLLESLITGLSSSKGDEDGSAGGYMGELAEAKALLTAAGTEAEQAKVKIGLAEREIKDKEPRAKKAEKEGEGLVKELAAKRTEVDQLRARVKASGWDEDKERSLLERQAEHGQKIAQLSEKRDTIKSRLALLDFEYTDPYPNFDRNKVKGLVATLVDLDETNYSCSTALEICAGGRLYNVVVDDAKTGAALLGQGKMRKRVTIIPLNKINAFRLSAQTIATAQKVAPGKVNLALDLIGCDEEINAAMAYVFGNVFVCKDKESAKAVTFNKAIGVRSVTLEGDVYDPSGSLSGGAAPSSSGVLVKVQELRSIEKQIAAHKKELEAASHELDSAKKVIAQWRKDKRAVDLCAHEVTLLEEQVNGSNATKNDKPTKIKELKADIANKKKELGKKTTQVKMRQKEVQTAELQIQQLESDLEAAGAEVKEAVAAEATSKAELAELGQQLKVQQAEHKAAEARFKAERALIARFDNEVNDLERDIKAKKQEITDDELSLKKLEHDLGLAKKERSSSPWILDEQQFFGKPGSPYDFNGVNLAQAREQCRELETQHKGMGRKINTKVMNMIDNVEKKESGLHKMMSTVLKDKAKIEATIVELDHYKRDALAKTWEKVNGDFGLIFAELLPGNFAKLQPSEGQDLTEGLEVKVRLGPVWKASLTELSGGQRSLIALSLIMSLLQFKPAPMYILDEIDAALDLQHTQHIGQLFRNRFKGSQFIVVSLKEGLFTNANVLFRTRFRDGTSIVERTATRSASVYDKENDESQTQSQSQPAPKRRGGGARVPLVVR
ncbi:hypothetical protein CcaverHIS002_0411080 [Cutaneotrichosporon cavernicola]|nr:hypothetical protein CcaverHIS002_0411080 [Cutaneotrichosporon cavernicola]